MFFTPLVHTAALAVTEEGTRGARFQLTGPGAVTVGFEAILPNLPEVVLVDITLVIVRADAAASRDRTID